MSGEVVRIHRLLGKGADATASKARTDAAMPYEGITYSILVASPVDVPNERKAAVKAIEEWNTRHSDHERIHLRAVLWERLATPEVGGDPQSIINRRLVDVSDFVIAIFGARLGSKTPRAESGTVEEIKEMVNSGKPALLYFSMRPIERDGLNVEQLAALNEFKEKLGETALYSEFKSLPELRTKIERDVTEIVYRLSALRTQADARPRQTLGDQDNSYLDQVAAVDFGATYERRRSLKACLEIGRGVPIAYRHDGIYVRFMLTNEGTFAARDVRISATAEPEHAEKPSQLLLEIPKIEPGSPPRPIKVRLPRHLREDPPRAQAWRVTLDIDFGDGLDERDQARYVYRISGRDPNLKTEIVRNQTRLSPLCRYLQPD